jgi:hypothetical protein
MNAIWKVPFVSPSVRMPSRIHAGHYSTYDDNEARKPATPLLQMHNIARLKCVYYYVLIPWTPILSQVSCVALCGYTWHIKCFAGKLGLVLEGRPVAVWGCCLLQVLSCMTCLEESWKQWVALSNTSRYGKLYEYSA